MAYFIKDPSQLFRSGSFTKEEEEYHNRKARALNAFEANRLREIAPAVTNYLRLVTPAMADTKFKKQMGELEADLVKWNSEAKAKYEKELENTLCADIVDKPSTMPRYEYWDRMFIITQAFFERVGIGFKRENREEM